MHERPLRVVFVDDERPIAELGARLLQQSGCRVMPFTSPLDALRHIEAPATSLDVLVTDHCMPELDGLALADRARALPVPADRSAQRLR